MPTIRIDTFAGEAARLHPSLLPDGCAVTAHNVVLSDGKLRPLRFPAISSVPVLMENGLSELGDTKSLYLWKRGSILQTLAWPGFVKVAPSNIFDDDRHRIFVTGETGVGPGKKEPCVYIENTSGGSFTRASIVKIKMPSPSVVTPVIPPGYTNLRYTRFYQTWVDSYGYMSPPSDPSAEITYYDGQAVTLLSNAAPENAVSRRIWKVVSGTETESIQFVYEQAAAGSTFPEVTFEVADADAGEILPMFGSPPRDLAWMTFVPGGYYVGVSPSNPRTVMFSLVGYPTTWPSDYRYDVRDDIVGIAVTGNTVIVLTKGAPWALTGTSPDSMTVKVMQSEQSCVSARSICVMDGVVFYASADGVCMIAPGSAEPNLVQVITEKYFDKRAWAALNPASCAMVPYDGALHCWFTTASGASEARVIRLQDGGAAVTRHDEEAVCACYDPETDRLYYVRAQ